MQGDQVEKELSGLIEIFKVNLQPPQTPSSAETANILRYLDNTPSLTTFRKTGLERFLANVGALPDGRVICTIPSSLSQTDFKFMPLVWGSKFGGCLRLLLPTDKAPAQAVFIPGANPFDALHAGRIIFCLYRLGRVKTIKEFRIKASVQAHSAFENLLMLCVKDNIEIAKTDSYISDVNLIRANGVSAKYFSTHWTRLEWLQRGWLNACALRSHDAISLIAGAKAEITTAYNLSFLRKYDLLHEVLSILNDGTLSKSVKISQIIGKYKSLPIAQLLTESFALERDLESIGANVAVAMRRALVVAHEIWQLLELDAELSDWGRRQISWDTQISWEALGEEITPVVIDPDNFPIEKDEEAASYWEHKRPTILACRDRFLAPFDLQLHPGSYIDSFTTWKVDLDESEARETIAQLLNEAVALREWTIPPNAFVELKVGPFIGAEVTEIGDDVFFVWRTDGNRYWDMSVDPSEQNFANTQIWTRDPLQPFDKSAELSVQLIMSAIIRDFWVVTERQKIFGVKSRRTGRKSSENRLGRVVYLPRVRYLGSKIDLTRLNLNLSYKQRSQHHVRSHFRKANPSQLQLEIAKRARKSVPEGHTYVQGHYRGVEGTEGQTVYRSRSAMALLFDRLDLTQPDYLSSTDWFGFERAVSILLERNFNCTIVHRAPRGKTDYGIDILATKAVGPQIETWVVQCKCYKPSILVNPSHMRELLGSIADLQRDGVAPVRGMMITTSRISGDARTLAVKHGIQCVTGDDLSSILDSINRANSSKPLH
jgi:Restriction endonuclease